MAFNASMYHLSIHAMLISPNTEGAFLHLETSPLSKYSMLETLHYASTNDNIWYIAQFY